MKVISKRIGDNIFFKNFCVIKEKDDFYAIYQKWNENYNTYNKNHIISSAINCDKACKKAKLLQIGYDMAVDDIGYAEYEW